MYCIQRTSFCHYDVQPFWPAQRNSLYFFAKRSDIKVSHEQIELLYLAFFILVAILYALAVRS